MENKAEVLEKTALKKQVLQNKRVIADKSIGLKSTPDPDMYKETEPWSYSGKRMVDLFFASLGLMVFAILFPIIATGIKLSSPGPVIFRQLRTGLHGRLFYCFKFRTMEMVQKVSTNGKPVITEKEDGRIFEFGRYLRKIYLDELPQIINILQGDMSLVGPRPYPVEECAYWNHEFDDHFYRYTVLPGITGYAQIKGYRGGTHNKDHMRKRLELDLIYTRNNNLILDIKIIFVTAIHVLKSFVKR
ncbi:MAG: sugar transferase [Balneolales bacterium]